MTKIDFHVDEQYYFHLASDFDGLWLVEPSYIMGNRHAGVWVTSITFISISLFQLQAPSPGSWDLKNLVNSLEAVFFGHWIRENLNLL